MTTGKARAYYNEFDPYAAQWLSNLIDAGHIPAGDIDTRSIEDVRPDELRGYTQCHFFAGIGGWPYALQLAGWGDRPVWTGSCPCQPFSSAGKGAGFADERHLWPAWFHLIRECRPPVVFGEQVASATQWLALVFSDMEGVDYAMGCVPIEAASAGAPHGRDRFFFVADTYGNAFCAQPHKWPKGGEQTPRWHHAGGCRSDAHAPGIIVVGSDGTSRPCEPGTQPMAHGIPGSVGRLRAFGNAIVPQVAAEFVMAYMEVRNATVARTQAPIREGTQGEAA